MTRLKLVTAVLLSYEALVLLIGCCLLLFLHHTRTNVEIADATSSLIDSVTAHIPRMYYYILGITGWNVLFHFNQGKTLLHPSNTNAQLLVKWHDYSDLVMYFKIGLFYALLFFVLSGVALLPLSDTFSFVIAIFSLIAVLPNSLSLYFATLKVQELLTRHEDPDV